MKTIYAGSTIDIEVSLTDSVGVALDIGEVSDVIVLLRYEDRTKGSVAKFAKNASSGILAWTSEDESTGKLIARVPASSTTALQKGKLLVDVKVVMPDGYKFVTTLGDTYMLIETNQLAND